MNDDQLGYVSSAPDFSVQRDEPTSIDEDQVSTLEEVLRMCDRDIAHYGSTASLSLDPDVLSVFSVEQQLAINEKVIQHINDQRTRLVSVITKVRTKQNGREQY